LHRRRNPEQRSARTSIDSRAVINKEEAMKPFILEQHARENPAIRELQREECKLATGGDLSCRPGQIQTINQTGDCYDGEECDDR
jgi:hypothetical protein